MSDQQHPSEESDQNKQKRPKISTYWWILIAILLIWNVISFLPKSSSVVSIPYSIFLDQVNAGNIKDVSISGDQITGSFVSAFRWPLAVTPAPTSTDPAVPTSAPLSTPSTYTNFNTVFPQAVGDSNLLSLLREKQVTINVSSPTTPWFTILLTDGLPLLLLVLVFVWMSRQVRQGQNSLSSFGHSPAKQYSHDHPEIYFNDVAGADEAKQDLQEVVDFLRNPQKYHDVGARIPRGVLLVGPPGTGKTLLAKAVAGEAKVPFFSLSASEFVEMFVGVGASRVRDLFEKAKISAPSIVFIDELDAVGRRRGAGLGNVNDEREQTLNQLLVEMDGFDDRHEVILLAATNRPDVLDPALLRPGRFDRQVVVGMPDRPGREKILRIHSRNLRLDEDVRFEVLSQATIGMNGADLANLCNEAALIAARHDHHLVTMVDFEQALDKILLGEERPLLMDEEARKVVAYHESGHAVVAWYTPGADPVHKVTIIPHGRALGVTEQLPEEDVFNYSRSALLARLAVMFGGRSAEEIAIGEITTGAENDIIQATRLARRMITRWAMGELGSVAFDIDDEQSFLGYEILQGRTFSETTAAKIDQEVVELLNRSHQSASDLLNQMRVRLDALAKALLDHETVDQDALASILGPRLEPSNLSL
jgi:cell division protease FtsH